MKSQTWRQFTFYQNWTTFRSRFFIKNSPQIWVDQCQRLIKLSTLLKHGLKQPRLELKALKRDWIFSKWTCGTQTSSSCKLLRNETCGHMTRCRRKSFHFSPKLRICAELERHQQCKPKKQFQDRPSKTQSQLISTQNQWCSQTPKAQLRSRRSNWKLKREMGASRALSLSVSSRKTFRKWLWRRSFKPLTTCKMTRKTHKIGLICYKLIDYNN